MREYEIPLRCGETCCGSLNCREEALRTAFSAQCAAPEGEAWTRPGAVAKVWLRAGDRALLLGTLAPAGAAWRLDRTLTASALRQAGVCPPEWGEVRMRRMGDGDHGADAPFGCDNLNYVNYNLHNSEQSATEGDQRRARQAKEDTAHLQDEVANNIHYENYSIHNDKRTYRAETAKKQEQKRDTDAKNAPEVLDNLDYVNKRRDQVDTAVQRHPAASNPPPDERKGDTARLGRRKEPAVSEERPALARPEQWRPLSTLDLPISEPQVRAALRSRREGWWRREEQRVAVCLPWREGQEFPIPELFCFSRIHREGRALRVLYLFSERWWPVAQE